MDRFTVLVNTRAFADLLATSSLRTLFTIAFYQGVPLSHGARTQGAVAADLAARVPGDSWMAYLRALGPTDGAIFARLLAEGVPLVGPVAHVRLPRQLYPARPAPTTLSALERFLACGLLFVDPGADRWVWHVPREVAAAHATLAGLPSPAAPTCPPLPPPADLVDDAVTLLGLVAARPPRHTAAGCWPLHHLRAWTRACAPVAGPPRAAFARLHLLHRLLHDLGCLALVDDRCTLAPAAAGFLRQPPTLQLRSLLAAWAAAPLDSAALPLGLHPTDIQWPAVLDWLFARLAELAPGRYAPGVLPRAWAAEWATLLTPSIHHPPPAQPPLPPETAADLLIALLYDALPPAGFIHADPTGLGVPPALAAGWRDRTLPPPTTPALADCVVTIPSLAAPDLRCALAAWADHTRTPTGHVYTFTLPGLRRARAAARSLRPLTVLLARHFPTLPPALADLLAQADQAPLPRRRARPAGPPRPTASSPAADQALTLALLQRLGSLHHPEHAGWFHAVGGDWEAALTPAQRLHLEDWWAQIDPPDPDEEILPPDADPPPALDPAVVRGLLAALIAAARPLRMRYFTAGRRAIGWRVVQPTALHLPCFTAWCTRVRAPRTFHTGRVLAVESADGRPLPAPRPDSPRRRPTGAGVWLAADYDDPPAPPARPDSGT